MRIVGYDEIKTVLAQDVALLVAVEVAKAGGTTYFVGGCVRDQMLGIANKDIDIEVHGLTAEQLRAILIPFNDGEPALVGKSFGMFGIKGFDLDIALPRTERQTGEGHKDFDVTVNPFLGTEEASRRRDFTINALMENVLTGKVVDHWNGKEDLKNKIIRHVDDEKFAEDPLRVLRAARFSAKLGFEVAPQTIELCKTIDLSSLSKERVMGETVNALLKSPKPSVFFETLRKMEQLSVWFPELEKTIDSPQSKTYHAEGDVWTHTMMVLDEVAKVRDKAENKTGLMLSALVHDFGKPLCTTIDEKGGIHSHGHEDAGLSAVAEFMKRLTNEVKLTKYVLNMTENHMKPHKYAEHRSLLKKTNRMFDDSVSPHDLVLLAVADDNGRICNVLDDNRKGAEAFLWERVEAYKETMAKPYVMGRDLISTGLKPSEEFTEILAYAHKLRLAGIEKESALKQTFAYARLIGVKPTKKEGIEK